MDKSLLTISAPTVAEEEKKEKSPRKKETARSPRSLIVSLCVYVVLVPLVIFAGVKLWNDRRYNIVSLIIAVLACVPFFIGFEKGRAGARELVTLAVMTALSVIGRLIFAPVPGFKPVTAIVIITAIAYGPQAGFITGALSAVVSNIFFGQGPWTPFQMFTWGFLGLASGLIFRRGKKPNVVLLILVGVAGGAAFSFMMDIWSVLNIDGGWSFTRYAALLISGAPFTLIYVVSNVVFLLVLTNPFLHKLNRLRDKYGVFG